jgi:hypothetical protein
VRVSLETGSMDEFGPARALYTSRGFTVCGPFGDYAHSPNSSFMTLELRPDRTPVNPRTNVGRGPAQALLMKHFNHARLTPELSLSLTSLLRSPALGLGLQGSQSASNRLIQRFLEGLAKNAR